MKGALELLVANDLKPVPGLVFSHTVLSESDSCKKSQFDLRYLKWVEYTSQRFLTAVRHGEEKSFTFCYQLTPEYGELTDGTPIVDRYPLPDGFELCTAEEAALASEVLVFDNEKNQWFCVSNFIAERYWNDELFRFSHTTLVAFACRKTHESKTSSPKVGEVWESPAGVIAVRTQEAAWFMIEGPEGDACHSLLYPQEVDFDDLSKCTKLANSLNDYFYYVTRRPPY